jgi:hypothetical protein
MEFLLRCMIPLLAHSVAFTRPAGVCLLEAKRTAMLRRGNSCF